LGGKSLPLVLEKTEDWQRFLATSPVPLLLCDAHGTVVLASEKLKKFLGPKIEGRKLEDFDLPPLSSQAPRFIFCKTCSGRLLKITYHLLRDEGNELCGAILHFEDVEEVFEEAFLSTYLRQEEGAILLSLQEPEEDRLLNKILEALKGIYAEGTLGQKEKVEALEILSRGLAHDFRNFLSAVEGNLELAEKARDPEEREHFLRRAQRALKRAREFTERLLHRRTAETYDLERLLRETAELLLSGTRIKWEVKVAPDVWCPRMDRVQLTQVLLNLIANAREAMNGDGRLVLEAENLNLTERKGCLRPGPYVRLCIRDTGPGIPKEDLVRIFKPAYSSKEKGHGFGLTMVYSIVRSCGGSIEVESREGEGTSFNLFLPALKTKRREEASGEEEKGAEEKGPRPSGPAVQRVLVIDDDPELLSVFSEMLALLGYEVETEKDPQQALSRYREALEQGQPFDYVILDYDLPHSTGLEILAALKEMHPEARIIITTGYTAPEIVETLKDSGAWAFLKKPFRLKDLASLL